MESENEEWGKTSANGSLRFALLSASQSCKMSLQPSQSGSARTPSDEP
jgi:hypothetical protein